MTGVLCKADFLGFPSEGFNSWVQKLRSPSTFLGVVSVLEGAACLSACLMVFLPLPCRNQDTRPASSNAMQRPQLGPNVSLPLEMGSGHLAAR